jgi:hypothetical protein
VVVEGYRHDDEKRATFMKKIEIDLNHSLHSIWSQSITDNLLTFFLAHRTFASKDLSV